jgi:hypothetical protein
MGRVLPSKMNQVFDGAVFVVEGVEVMSHALKLESVIMPAVVSPVPAALEA